MPTRYWQLPGGNTARDEAPQPWAYNLFWYCHRCGETYARTWCVEPDMHWRGIIGHCTKCNGDRWNVPGSLETILLVGWRVPVEVLNYQLDCELAFTRHPDHPWNKDQTNDNT